MPRIELYNGKDLVDEIAIHRYSVAGLNYLLEHDLNQPRDHSLSWEMLRSAAKVDDLMFNYDARQKMEKEANERQKAREKSEADQ